MRLYRRRGRHETTPVIDQIQSQEEKAVKEGPKQSLKKLDEEISSIFYLFIPQLGS